MSGSSSSVGGSSPLLSVQSLLRSSRSSLLRASRSVLGDGRQRTRISTAPIFAAALLPMEPRPLTGRQRPWFEGWFFRFTDHATGASAAIIFGSLRGRLHERERQKPRPAFDEHLLVLGYRDGRGVDVSRSVLLDGDAVTLGKGGGPSARVSWWSARHGGVRLSAAGTELDVRFADGMRLAANISSARVPWNCERPDRDGPEGWLSRTGLLPCHYFVHSFSSPSAYAVWDGEARRARHIGGDALAHVERNYGASFPSGWVWAQASAAAGRASFVLTGGRFVIGPLTMESFVVGLRVPTPPGTPASHARLSWDFRTTDLDRVDDVRHPCEGTLFVNATSRDGRRRLELLLAAPRASFGPPIMVPTHAGGFSDRPGCRESYAALAHVWAWSTERGGRRPERQMAAADQLRIDIPLAVLEFGGDRQCLTLTA